MNSDLLAGSFNDLLILLFSKQFSKMLFDISNFDHNYDSKSFMKMVLYIIYLYLALYGFTIKMKIGKKMSNVDPYMNTYKPCLDKNKHGPSHSPLRCRIML